MFSRESKILRNFLKLSHRFGAAALKIVGPLTEIDPASDERELLVDDGVFHAAHVVSMVRLPRLAWP
jgi:hypothetical protein